MPEEDNKIPVMTEPGIPQIQRSANHLTVTLQICMIVYTYVQTHHKVTVITIKEYKQWFLPVQWILWLLVAVWGLFLHPNYKYQCSKAHGDHLIAARVYQLGSLHCLTGGWDLLLALASTGLSCNAPHHCKIK